MERILEYRQYLDTVVLSNTVQQLLTAAAIFVVVYLVLVVVKKVLIKRLLKISKKTKMDLDDAVIGFLDGIKQMLLMLIALYVALKGIAIPNSVSLVVDLIFLVAIVSQVIRLVEVFVAKALEPRFQREDGTGGIPEVFRVAMRVVLWSVGLLLILSNIGIDVTSLIAGLGIGGLAISLALQNILGDMFSSFSIAVDKPFEEGDFIIIGDYQGTVKHIGLKTTRIIALQGEEVVISNAELTSARVRNFKKMQKRRVVFEIGVTYDTPLEKLKKIPAMIGKIIEDHDMAEFDRVHFITFGDSNLLYECVYFMKTSDYNAYMDTQQDINNGIVEAFEKEGIEMAYPTQTIYMKN